MTINEAITQADRLLKNNSIPYDIKVKWLSDLDFEIYLDVILTHEMPTPVEFEPYDDTTDGETVLLIPAPYDGIYVAYLKMKINAELYEFTRYNNDMQTYNSMLGEFKAYYNRNYRPSKYGNMRCW